VQNVPALPEQNLRACDEYLKIFPRDYKVPRRFLNAGRRIAGFKVGKNIPALVNSREANGLGNYDLVFTRCLPTWDAAWIPSAETTILLVGPDVCLNFPTQ
jgi:hypothetical protein